LKVDGRDVRNLALIERKMRLKALMPKGESKVRYVEEVEVRHLQC